MPQDEQPEQQLSLEELVEEFLERLRLSHTADGESVPPTVEEYVARRPDLAEEIRDIFPAMMAMEGLKERHSRQTGPPSLAAVPDQLGEFRLLRPLGHGGMGAVYEALQQTLDRKVALKVLPPGLLEDERARARFQNETRIAARLEHPGIVSIYAVGQEQGQLYFAMQRIQGASLAECLRWLRGADQAEIEAAAFLAGERLLPELVRRAAAHQEGAAPASVASAEPKTVLQQLGARYYREMAACIRDAAQALQFAHEKGVLHRDIKPGNLLLDLEGRTYVADFGLARALESHNLTRSGEIIGTLRYMPPEQFDDAHASLGATELAVRGDVYSLGAVLYECLCLVPAFSGESVSRLMRRILLGNKIPAQEMAPGLPEALASILERAMALDPQKRYETAAEMAEDLERFLQGRWQGAASHVSIGGQTAARPRRGRRWLLAAAAVLLASVLGGWFWLQPLLLAPQSASQQPTGQKEEVTSSQGGSQLRQSVEKQAPSSVPAQQDGEETAQKAAEAAAEPSELSETAATHDQQPAQEQSEEAQPPVVTQQAPQPQTAQQQAAHPEPPRQETPSPPKTDSRPRPQAGAGEDGRRPLHPPHRPPPRHPPGFVLPPPEGEQTPLLPPHPPRPANQAQERNNVDDSGD